jgi:hypothetical protein
MMTMRALTTCPQAEVLMKVNALVRWLVLMAWGKADEICGLGIQAGEAYERLVTQVSWGHRTHNLPCCETELPRSVTRTLLRCMSWHPRGCRGFESTSFVLSMWCVCQILMMSLFMIEKI